MCIHRITQSQAPRNHFLRNVSARGRNRSSKLGLGKHFCCPLWLTVNWLTPRHPRDNCSALKPESPSHRVLQEVHVSCCFYSRLHGCRLTWQLGLTVKDVLPTATKTFFLSIQVHKHQQKKFLKTKEISTELVITAAMALQKKIHR